jgi:NAD(P) transhydrogenase subunit alpha
MLIGLPKESRWNEARVGFAPETIKKLRKKGFRVCVERSCGALAGFLDEDYTKQGAELGDAYEVFSAPIVVKIHRPTFEEASWMQKGSWLICFIEPFLEDDLLKTLAGLGVHVVSMESVPRTSRAQSMDALSSQANIAGYRAVLEAASHYKRFFPIMMTSAGSAKAVRVLILGVGVAGLQAIATARRLGAMVEAYDVRSEVKEQIRSLGAKVLELELGEEGAGQGGYAQQLSQEAQKRQQELLEQRIQNFDVVISTANIPGKKAPVLITEQALQGMRSGSVVVDMAAGNGGNCPWSEPEEVVVKHGVTLVGYTNYPSRLASDASAFYGNNVVALLDLFVQNQEGSMHVQVDLQDDIVSSVLVVYQGELRDLGPRKG